MTTVVVDCKRACQASLLALMNLACLGLQVERIEASLRSSSSGLVPTCDFVWLHLAAPMRCLIILSARSSCGGRWSGTKTTS